jgi:predicted amidophosphoribosyltransferase
MDQRHVGFQEYEKLRQMKEFIESAETKTQEWRQPTCTYQEETSTTHYSNSTALTEDEVNSEEHTLRIKTCLRCQEPNSPTSGFCSRCGCPLDVKTAMQLHEEESKIDNVMDLLLQDTEVKEVLLSKLKAMTK